MSRKLLRNALRPARTGLGFGSFLPGDLRRQGHRDVLGVFQGAAVAVRVTEAELIGSLVAGALTGVVAQSGEAQAAGGQGGEVGLPEGQAVVGAEFAFAEGDDGGVAGSRTEQGPLGVGEPGEGQRQGVTEAAFAAAQDSALGEVELLPGELQQVGDGEGQLVDEQEGGVRVFQRVFGLGGELELYAPQVSRTVQAALVLFFAGQREAAQRVGVEVALLGELRVEAGEGAGAGVDGVGFGGPTHVAEAGERASEQPPLEGGQVSGVQQVHALLLGVLKGGFEVASDGGGLAHALQAEGVDDLVEDAFGRVLALGQCLEESLEVGVLGGGTGGTAFAWHESKYITGI